MAKRQRGLNTGGMTALFGDISPDTGVPQDFMYIPLSRVQPRANQPRVVFAQEPLEELASSIREHGVLTPIAVRAVGDGYYEIIAGERRWRAARMAELSQIPARVLAVDDQAAMELSLIENLQRENLNPIEEAQGYHALGEDYGLSQEEIAQRMGKSRPVVANALRLLSLPDEVLDLVRGGELQAGTARALLAIRNDMAMVNAAREVVEKGLSTREAERLARKVSLSPKAYNVEKDTPRAGNYMAEFEQILGKSLGRRVKIAPGKGNGGKFEISYYNADDFERLYNGLASLGEDDA